MFRRDALRLGAGILTGTGLSLATGTPPASAHPGPYQPYGSVELDGAKEAVVGPDDTVYVATSTGYATVDVSTPDRPSILADVRDPLADREDGPLRGIYDVKVAGDRLLVVGPANPLPGALSGVLVVDVADPAAPEELAFYQTDFPIHNCYLADGYAYLTGNDGDDNPLVILDIVGDGTADAPEPREAGRWALVDHEPAWAEVNPWARAVHDVWVHDDVAYAPHWDAGTWILDVSDPTTPTAIGSIDVAGRTPAALASLSESALRRETTAPPGNHHYVATDETGALLGVGREAWATDDGTGGPGGIDLYDVADPADPTHLSHIAPPSAADETMGGTWTTSHNFELADGRLYSSWYQGGVKRHDVSDPTAPRELAWWRDPGAARFWTARLVVPGATAGYFVATSMGLRDVPARLYTFPDHAGSQSDPPALVATETPNPNVVTATPTSSVESSPSPGTSDDAAATPSNGTGPNDGTGGSDGSTPGDGTDERRPASTAPVPGFGAGAAGGAAGLLALRGWLRARRTDAGDRERTPDGDGHDGD